jgi:hypothetical protein
MLKLRAKIETFPLCAIYVRGNFKVQKNKKIRFREKTPFVPLRNTPWRKGWIDDINNEGILFISRL